MGKYSPENQQKIHVHTSVIRTLAKARTPDLGLGSTKGVVTVTSKVKDFLPTRKIDLEREDVYSEAPVEGGPKVAELSEDLVDSKRLIEVLDINPELSAVERDRIQEVIIKNHLWTYSETQRCFLPIANASILRNLLSIPYEHQFCLDKLN